MITTNKQDRQGPRTPADLERKYQLGTLGVRFAEVMGIATDARKISVETSAAVGEVSSIVAKISEEVESISITVEDLDTGKLADLSVRIGEITASVSECATKEELDGYVTHEKLSSELKVTTEAITASVSADYVKNDTLNGYVTSEKLSSELELTQKSITAKVEADYVKNDTLNGYVTAEKLSSELELTQKSITASVESSYVKSDTLTGYATKTDLELTTNQIKASVSETYTTQDEFGTYQESVTGEFVIGIINKESVAKISADRLDIEGKKLNIKVDATNIDGTLQVGQLPSGVAFTGDIKTKVSELENDLGYQDRSGVVQIMDGIMTADYIISGLGATIGRWAIADELLCAYGQTGTIKVSAGLKPNQIITRRDDLIKGQTQATIISSGMMEIYREGDNFVMPEFARFYFGGYEYSLYVDFNDNNRVKAYNWGRYQTGQIPKVPEIGIEIGLETVRMSFSVEWRDENGEVWSNSYNFTPDMTWYDICDRDDAFMIDSGAAILFNGDTLYFEGAEVTASDNIVEGGIYYTNY